MTSQRNRRMNAAVQLMFACTAASLCLCGCSTIQETPIRRPGLVPAPYPLRVGVLPLRIDSSLLPENLTPEKPFLARMIDGRGIVVGSATPAHDIALEVVSTLSQAKLFERIFLVEDRKDAERLGADSLLALTVHDYRVVMLGANPTGLWATLTSPLMSRYWLRWQTIEARLDFDAQLITMEDGSTLHQKCLRKTYTSPVRSASGKLFAEKMLSFLQNRVSPDFIGELFSLQMVAPVPPIDRYYTIEEYESERPFFP